MNDTIRELLTRDNITLALSIFGALGTIFTIISTFILTEKIFPLILHPVPTDMENYT